MQDEKGLYYYPNPQNKRVRMYVREEGGEVFFRLWNQDDPELFEDHGWVPWGARPLSTPSSPGSASPIRPPI